MKYYIDKVNTWSPANRKCLEVQSFAKEFRQTLIPNEDAAEALVEELRQKVEAIENPVQVSMPPETVQSLVAKYFK